MRDSIPLIDVRVARKRVEAEGIVSFEFVRTDCGVLPTFEPGAHIDVYVPGGLLRQYSLCSPTSCTDRYQIAVQRDPASRGGSEAMYLRLAEGDIVRISEPRNHFPLQAGAAQTLLIGGGIGITPLLCMAEKLARTNASFELHYSTRSPSRTAFHEVLRNGPFANLVHFHFDDGGPEQKLDISARLASCSSDTHLYVCGPKGFMDAVLSKARELDWSDSRIHFEYFGAQVVHKAGDGPFEIQLARSGMVVQVASNQSIAAALAVHSVEIPMSCEQGVCGTCLTRVISGTPDHRDMYLTSAEQEKNDLFLPCCSRSKSARLVIDL